MLPERFPPNDPREWMNRAKSNMAQASAVQPGVYLEDLCFNAQQAAEKALKALLIHHKVRFPFTHDLERLVQLLEEVSVEIPPVVRDAIRLTDYATGTRYPSEELP